VPGVSFSTDLATLVANQLTRFVTLNPHQLAGQVANLDFWLAQVRHALDTLEGYGVRFVRMDGAQQQYVAAHGTTVSSKPFIDVDPVNVAPPPPRRIPHHVLNKARRELLDAAGRFLRRCRDEGMISEAELAAACREVGLDRDTL
jgi:hypothetical protein